MIFLNEKKTMKEMSNFVMFVVVSVLTNSFFFTEENFSFSGPENLK